VQVRGESSASAPFIYAYHLCLSLLLYPLDHDHLPLSLRRGYSSTGLLPPVMPPASGLRLALRVRLVYQSC
jgi:hypothetical protein